MSATRQVLDGLFQHALDTADDLSAEYQLALENFRVHALAVVEDLEAGKITAQQAAVATEQLENAARSTLLSGAYDVQKATQKAVFETVVAGLKIALMAI